MAKGAAWVGAVDIFTTEVDDVTVDLAAAADEEPMGAVNPPTTDTANAKDKMESFILILQDCYYCNHSGEWLARQFQFFLRVPLQKDALLKRLSVFRGHE